MLVGLTSRRPRWLEAEFLVRGDKGCDGCGGEVVGCALELASSSAIRRATKLVMFLAADDMYEAGKKRFSSYLGTCDAAGSLAGIMSSAN